MNKSSRKVQRTYLTLTLLNTLAASFIWGINTLFLLDAGLSATEAFSANAFFTLGQVIFEVPTGVVADTRGRRTSFLLGAGTLLLATILYLWMWQIQAPFWAWAASSAVIGLGFTFFSGAVEAWLVDCLDFTKYKGALESVFAKGQVTSGIAMLGGSVAGGYIAQATNLGVPYILRSVLLGVTFIVAYITMKDLGFKPDNSGSPMQNVKKVLRTSIDEGLRKPSVRWLMLSSPFSLGVGAFAFYAMQPYLLELYGDPTAYGVAGLAAAIVAGAQIVGGLMVPFVKKRFTYRTSAIILGAVISAVALAVIGLTGSFVIAVGTLVVWGLTFAAVGPIRQAYMNGEIPSKQRATVLSFDSLLGSAGAVVSQPALGRVADVWSYSTAYIISGVVQLGALPFLFAAKKVKPKSDKIDD